MQPEDARTSAGRWKSEVRIPKFGSELAALEGPWQTQPRVACRQGPCTLQQAARTSETEANQQKAVPSISQIQRAGTGAFGTIRLLKGASLANLFTLLGGRVRYGVVTLK